MSNIRFVTLMEDYLCGDHLVAEHGLSLYIETKKHKLLVDTGQSDQTWENAKAKGIDISLVDTVILSHGHYDHSGGLMKFAAINKTADIYMRDNAAGAYYSYKKDKETYIGIDKEILKLSNLHLVSDSTVIDDELSLFTNVKPKHSWPKGNRRLYEKKNGVFVPDTFSHEQYLVITYDGGKYALISGCAHTGILNILDSFHEIYGRAPSIVISGFHMIQSEYADDDVEEIKHVAKELSKLDTIFYTGHCTGEVAYKILKERMGEQLHAIAEL